MVTLRSLTKNQIRDSGLALALLAQIVSFILSERVFGIVACILLIACMTLPTLFTPFAWCWWNLAFLLNAVVSRILFGAIFFSIITPISLSRKLFGGDPFKQKLWKCKGTSAFTERNHEYSIGDIQRPF